MTLTVLEKIVLFILDIRLWTGRKKLRPEDLAANGITPDQLPPGSLASLGSKKIIGHEALSPFLAIKREAEKVLLAKGVRFLNGYAVPAEEAPAVTQRLLELKREFETARTSLLQSYDEAIRTWIAANPPEWAPVIRAAVDPAHQVEKSLAFRYTPVSITPPEEASDEELAEQTEGLYGQLCHEVRLMAQTAFDASFAGRKSVTRKALRPIHAIRRKLAALVFLDPEIANTLQTIDDTLALVPEKGPIQGSGLNLLAGLLSRELACLGRPASSEEPEAEMEDTEEMNQESGNEDPPMITEREYAPLRPAMPLAWDF